MVGTVRDLEHAEHRSGWTGRRSEVDVLWCSGNRALDTTGQVYGQRERRARVTANAYDMVAVPSIEASSMIMGAVAHDAGRIAIAAIPKLTAKNKAL